MIASNRRLHRAVWPVLFVVIVLILTLAWKSRHGPAVMDQLPAVLTKEAKP